MVKKRKKYVSKRIDIKRDRAVKNKNYIYIVIVALIVIMAIIFIKCGLEAEKNTKSVYQYKVEKKSDYEVILKENDFYSTKTLPAGLHYASKSIDSFNINLEYNFKGNNKINTKYSYNVTANLVGVVKDGYEDKEVWNKSFSIIENKNNEQVDIDEFSIKEKININYEEYNELARAYEDEYGIKIDAVLKVRFDIAYQPDFSNYGVSQEEKDDFIELDIPITNNVTEVNENYEKENIVNVMPPIEKIRIKEYSYYIIAGLLMILALIISIIKLNKNKMSSQEKYEKNVNRILKYYRDIIVTVNNEPDLIDLKIMEVASLDDLVDVAEQNGCNIIHYEDLVNRLDYMYVIVDNYAYYYKI